MSLSSQVKRFALLWFLSVVISVYRAFVLMMLWNWFVTRAFHVDSVSFLLMLGISWFIELVTRPSEQDAAFYSSNLYPLVLLCVPENKQEEAREQMEQFQSDIWSQLWTSAGSRVFDITLTLGLGFVVTLFV